MRGWWRHVRGWRHVRVIDKVARWGDGWIVVEQHFEWQRIGLRDRMRRVCSRAT